MANPTGKGGWQKGQSGNPKGRPEKPALSDEERQRLRALAIDYATDPNHPEHHNYLMKFMDKVFPSLKAETVKLEGDVSLPEIIISVRNSDDAEEDPD